MINISLALLIVDNKILLLKRSDKMDDFPEMYGLPGGHVKDNEDSIDALKREVKEETTLTLKNPTFVNTYKFGRNKIFVYTETLKSTRGIKLNREHSEFKLFSPDELKNKDVINSTVDMYKDYKKIKTLNEEIKKINSLIKVITEENYTLDLGDVYQCNVKNE